ncbi:MAG: PAS domain-containing protein, partial [Candidatus Cyclonatronum sp.]|uniref:CheR family methyltransferase n=1 Tax=Cyclonatronum sp. TaxID=3024185 RepID=UPI0025C0C28A
DVDRTALEQAGTGYYPDSIVTDLDPELLLKYFHRHDSGFQVNESIRKTIVFATHNLLKDPPFSKLDLLICRNLFIYIKPEMQHRLLSSFFYSLSPGGYLFLGSSETLGSMHEGYDTIDSKWKIYKVRNGYRPPIMQSISRPTYMQSDKPAAKAGPRRNGDLFRMDKVTEKLLELLAPASIIVDSNDQIVHIINNVSRFISFRSGRFSNNLFNNLNPDFAVVITTLLHRMRKHGEGLVLSEELTDIPGFEADVVLLEGRLVDISDVQYAVISFKLKHQEKDKTASGSVNEAAGRNDAGKASRLSARADALDLQNELKQVKENLQATVEELETSNEELQSSNEELIASNEELQSTNEELQSVNEELFTVNYEYQSKIDELTKTNNDINNLLKNTEIGALYLDTKLCIRKLTPLVAEITHILPTDIGRPMSHISVMNIYPDMLDDINFVAETLQARDREIQALDKRVFLVRTRPYRTQNNAVEGILLTFVEITRVKEEQARYRDVAGKLTRALELGQMSCWSWNPDTDEFKADDPLPQMLGYPRDAFPATLSAFGQQLHPSDLPDFQNEKQRMLSGKNQKWEEIFRIKHAQGHYIWLRLSAGLKSAVREDKTAKPVVDGVFSNISGLQELKNQRKIYSLAIAGVLNSLGAPALIIDQDFTVIQQNKLFSAMAEDVVMSVLTHPDWKFGLGGKYDSIKAFLTSGGATGEIENSSVYYKDKLVFEGKISFMTFNDGQLSHGGLLVFSRTEVEQ